eukprot:160239_1
MSNSRKQMHLAFFISIIRIWMSLDRVTIMCDQIMSDHKLTIVEYNHLDKGYEHVQRFINHFYLDQFMLKSKLHCKHISALQKKDKNESDLDQQ